MAEQTKRRNISLPIPDDILLHDMAEANSVRYSRLVSMVVYDWLQEQRHKLEKGKEPSILYRRYLDWKEQQPDTDHQNSA